MSSSKNLSIQSFRAIAALMVFLSHSLMMIKSDTIARLHDTPLHFFFDGQCAVVFFMVLSGYLYYKAESFSLRKYAKGLWRKVVRIYPAHIIMIGVGVLLCNLQLPYHAELFSEWGNSFWGQPIGMAETLRQMIIALPGTDPYLVNPPVWYLQVEVRMFILMPLIIGLLNKFGESKDTVAFWVTLIVLGCVSCIVYPFAACYLLGYIAAHIQNKHIVFEPHKMTSLLSLGGVFCQ